MNIFIIVILFILACFAVVLLFGAPYLPTLKQQQAEALKMLDLKRGETLLELGCGDGRMLVTAAKQGINGVGYELNPIIFLIAKVVTFKYRRLVRVEYGNFWHKKWPPTDGIYVFLHTRFMNKLDNKVIQQYNGKKIKLVSYAFPIVTKRAITEKNALFLYEYN
ncbi:class I SAM-dependent methyltransferase [Candidatus Saccharibacteria bacterium]|nr:class I SAM-dependent methyltransferase [Candidatus Saccharibacteria bacterium]